ncbi:MAG: DNA photolyase [Deltaproteobacteria bacterium]|nr:DNA photolyase [Deltaproteobacteria bacterium]
MKYSKIYIEKEIEKHPETLKITSQSNAEIQIIKDAEKLFKKISKAADPIGEGKKILLLSQNKGPFLKKCPGTKNYICCGYKILHIASFCTMDCSYCILQAYFHPPILRYFVNTEDMEKELDALFAEKTIYRVGTGEFSDSLIFENNTNISANLTEKFGGQKHCILELKTKTVNIKKLQGLNHNRKTIISWSLNTQKVIAEEERDTASLDARLKAAAQCEKWGYPLAFHFDPIIIYKGAEEDYKKVIKKLFSIVSKDNIVWISIGTFRFIPTLKKIIETRFKNSKIIYGEFIKGLDNKMRYFKPIRIEIYKKIISYIKQIAPEVLIYFCMEDEQVWQKSFGFTPEQKGGLASMLDKSAKRHCGLL